MILFSKRCSPIQTFWRLILLTFCLFLLPAALRAQQEDFDQYKVRIGAFWFYSDPSGTFQGSTDRVPINVKQDLNFNTYSTFAGQVDWKFTRKNHLYVAVIPFDTSRQAILSRTIVFQNQTFDAGLAVKGSLHSVLVAPGYQYDIIRRRRGHLGFGVHADLFDTSAKISAIGQVNSAQRLVSASASRLLPIPVIGPEFRLYLTNSPRLFVEGNIYGMYFGGYGDFVSSAGDLGLTLTKNISINAGYQLGSRLKVQKSSSANRIGVDLTQRGAIVGTQFSF